MEATILTSILSHQVRGSKSSRAPPGGSSSRLKLHDHAGRDGVVGRFINDDEASCRAVSEVTIDG
jgi:hypothetical protein